MAGRKRLDILARELAKHEGVSLDNIHYRITRPRGVYSDGGTALLLFGAANSRLVAVRGTHRVVSREPGINKNTVHRTLVELDDREKENPNGNHDS